MALANSSTICIGIERPAFWKIFFHQGGKHAQDDHVRGNQLIDVLTLDLDHDFTAGLECGPVDLANARRSQGLRIG